MEDEVLLAIIRAAGKTVEENQRVNNWARGSEENRKRERTDKEEEWQEVGAPPPIHRVSGLASPDQKTVEENRQGLWVGAPEGAIGQVAVGREGCRGRTGV